MDNLVFQLLIGTFMLFLTVFSHAFVLDILMRRLHWFGDFFERWFKRSWKSHFVSFVVLYVFASHIIHIWMWAIAYLVLDVFHGDRSLELALYFSSSSFTTVGFGDVFLDEQWRMLSAVESVNGFLLFGWSTAFIFEMIMQIYRREAKGMPK